MRKMRITSRTSINGMRLISSSSLCVPRRKSTLPPSGRALTVDDFHQFHRLAFHFDDERVDLMTVMPVKDHAGNRDDQAHGGVVERDRDAVREHYRIATARRLGSED